MAAKLKIAFLVNNKKELPEWEMQMVRNLMNSDVAVIEAFIVADPGADEKRSAGIKFFQKFEDLWFRSIADAFRISAVINELGVIPQFSISDSNSLVKLDLDIIYCSCLVADSRDLTSFARYGFWFNAFGSGNSRAYGQIAFHDVMNDRPETSITLFVKLEGYQHIIPVYQGTTGTVPYSVKNTLNMIGWKSSSFLIYRITELSLIGAELFFRKYKSSGKGIQSEVVVESNKYPGNLKLSGLFLRNIFRYLRNKISNFPGRKRFTLLYSHQKFEISGVDAGSFMPMKLPKGIFWADPFVIEKEGKTFIFFEEYQDKKNKAHISVMELGKDGHWSEPVVVLDKPYHLSYPFIFESDNVLYMIPETSNNKTVELYKCIAFPLKWEFVQNLMENIILIDATMFYYQDKWWMFATGQNHPHTTTNDQLLLYYSDNLLSSDWKAHPQNPVATNISNCRPAGSIFQTGDKYYRPSQNNSSRQYGYAIKINEIEILNETEYKEKEVFEIVPGRRNKLSAIHTINFIKNLIVIDGVV